jgi:hypothetical protein
LIVGEHVAQKSVPPYAHAAETVLAATRVFYLLLIVAAIIYLSLEDQAEIVVTAMTGIVPITGIRMPRRGWLLQIHVRQPVPSIVTVLSHLSLAMKLKA